MLSQQPVSAAQLSSALTEALHGHWLLDPNEAPTGLEAQVVEALKSDEREALRDLARALHRLWLLNDCDDDHVAKAANSLWRSQALTSRHARD